MSHKIPERLKAELRSLASILGVSVKFKFLAQDVEGASISGYADFDKSLIVLDQGLPNYRIVQVFYHELGHFYCCANNLFMSYHGGQWDTKAQKRKAIRTALRAERWVDNWGKRMYSTHRYAKKYPWVDAYQKKESVRFLHAMIRDA